MVTTSFRNNWIGESDGLGNRIWKELTARHRRNTNTQEKELENKQEEMSSIVSKSTSGITERVG